MHNVTIITRADDCGSNHSANLGILQALEGGILKNVSIMATCDSVAEAAELFSKRTDVCFGLHFVLNAEWDAVKWGPVSDKAKVPTLVCEQGYFPEDPQYFTQQPPRMEEVFLELEAQMNRLIELGFTISYVDTHMILEWGIAGLEDALRTWCQENGYLYWGDYFSVPPIETGELEKHIRSLEELASGQFLMITHPAVDSQEMRLLSNSYETGAQIGPSRAQDILLWTHPDILNVYEKKAIRPIRYDKALVTSPMLPK
jgi:hypothetical protein